MFREVSQLYMCLNGFLVIHLTHVFDLMHCVDAASQKESIAVESPSISGFDRAPVCGFCYNISYRNFVLFAVLFLQQSFRLFVTPVWFHHQAPSHQIIWLSFRKLFEIVKPIFIVVHLVFDDVLERTPEGCRLQRISVEWSGWKCVPLLLVDDEFRQVLRDVVGAAMTWTSVWLIGWCFGRNVYLFTLVRSNVFCFVVSHCCVNLRRVFEYRTHVRSGRNHV